MSEKAVWQDPKTYGGYVKNFQEKYDHDPVIQASVQLIMSVFAVTVFIFLAIRPTLGTITTLVKKIDDQKLVDQKLDLKIAQLNNAQELLSSSGDELEKLLGKAVPTHPLVDIWAKEVELLGVENQVAISSLQVDQFDLDANSVGGAAVVAGVAPQMIAGKGKVISFTLNGGGDGGVQKFLLALEKIDRVVRIDSVEISKPENNTRNSAQLTFSVKGGIFFIPEAPTPTDAIDQENSETTQ